MIKKEFKSTQLVLYTCIDSCLRLLHPSMPFITEELWQRLPGKKEFESIMISPYPKENKLWENKKIEKDIDFIMEITKKIRLVKASYTLANHIKCPVIIECSKDSLISLIKKVEKEIMILGFCGEIEIIEKKEKKPEGCVIEIIDENCMIHVLLKGYLNVELEMKKLESNKKEFEKGIAKLNELISSKSYDKVPELIKSQNSEKLTKYKLDIEITDKAMKDLENMK